MNQDIVNERDRNGPKIKALLELRPALEGFAGIPQETRLLFRGLCQLRTLEVEGMLQTSHRRLARGAHLKHRFWSNRTPARRIGRYSRVIISMMERPFRGVLEKILDWFQHRSESLALQISLLTNIGKISLTCFESALFSDFTWRSMFSKTLPASDFATIARCNHRVCSTPWHTMHMVGLRTLNWRTSAKYPKLDTKGFDIFIGQTPYPARVDKNTTMVIRYHDAIPVLMPHTIPDKSIHQATHFYALMANVKSGAWFACVSETTRQDLLRLFPEASSRSVTIHNMVAHQYFREDSSAALVPGIIRSRLYRDPLAIKENLVPKFLTLREQERFYARLHCGNFRYLLVVSTIEPRKNHQRLLAAWEVIKAEIDPDLKLVVVAALGWEYGSIAENLSVWIERGEVFLLSAVPAPDLRVLYRHAEATVCPSLGEGFDYSGVESMRSGGVTVASDIPVHREVYDDAAVYFDPYSTASVVSAIRKILYDTGSSELREELLRRGDEVSSRYLPIAILPKWEAFLRRVTTVD